MGQFRQDDMWGSVTPRMCVCLIQPGWPWRGDKSLFPINTNDVHYRRTEGAHGATQWLYLCVSVSVGSCRAPGPPIKVVAISAHPRSNCWSNCPGPKGPLEATAQKACSMVPICTHPDAINFLHFIVVQKCNHLQTASKIVWQDFGIKLFLVDTYHK